MPVGWIRRVTAIFAIALWLFLSSSAASPKLHHRLHGDGATEADNCAVVQFTNGVTLPTPADLPTLPDSGIFFIRSGDAGDPFFWQRGISVNRSAALLLAESSG